MERMTESGDPNSFRAKSVSTENSNNYNITWQQNGYIVESYSNMILDRWPFRLRDETEEEFKERMNQLKNS